MNFFYSIIMYEGYENQKNYFITVIMVNLEGAGRKRLVGLRRFATENESNLRTQTEIHM